MPPRNKQTKAPRLLVKVDPANPDSPLLVNKLLSPLRANASCGDSSDLATTFNWWAATCANTWHFRLALPSLFLEEALRNVPWEGTARYLGLPRLFLALLTRFRISPWEKMRYIHLQPRRDSPMLSQKLVSNTASLVFEWRPSNFFLARCTR